MTHQSIAALGLACLSTVATAQRSTPARWNDYSRQQLSAARADRDTTVRLIIAAKAGDGPSPPQTDAVLRTIRAMGGTIRFLDSPSGYVHARVPLTSVDQILTAPIAAIIAERDYKPAADRDYATDPSGGGWGYREAEERAKAEWAKSVPTFAWNEDPLNHPYDPSHENGSDRLRRGHPTYDGRGVTIGQIEAPIDLWSPELAESFALDGKKTRKIVDVVTTILPDDPENIPGGNPWVSMRERVSVTNGGQRELRFHDSTYEAPRAGKFRIGVATPQSGRFCWFIDPKEATSYWAHRFAGDRPPPCAFGILWDTASGEVWVDADRDHRFGNEKPLRDYHIASDIGSVGKDDPSTPTRESYPFVIQTSLAQQAVALIIGMQPHATMVASTAVGSRGSKGKFDGIAPGARLINFQSNFGSSGGIEGTITAFRDPRVDIIVDETTGQCRNGVFLRYGDACPAGIVIERLTQATGKVYVSPGGNSTQELGFGADQAAARYAFVAGASQGKGSYWINYALRTQPDDNLHGVGPYGPGGDGRLIPTVSAPSGFLAASTDVWDYSHRGIHAGLKPLPGGYMIGSGTSQGGPSLAGALALIMSAAKQERVPCDPERLWLAVTNSARFMPQIPAYKQGNGIVDVAAAFELLKAYKDRPPSIRIESRGPVHHTRSAELPAPNEGVSLWERDGWAPGMRAERTITLKRTTGPSGPMTFALAWQGNDGTFSGPSSVVLPLNTVVPVKLMVGARTSGYHSALLSVDHPSVPGHVYRMMPTIVAGERLDAAHQHTATFADTLQQPGPSKAFYVTVPPNTAKLTFSASADLEGDQMWRWLDGNGQEGFWCRGAGCGAPRDTTISNPAPGVWSVTYAQGAHGVDFRRTQQRPSTEPDPPVKLKLTVRATPKVIP